MAGCWKNRPDGANWGDFGPDYEPGRLNVLTPERVRRAVAEVREGLAFCLSLPLDYPGGNHPAPAGTGRHASLPLHELCLFKLGIHLGELWYLSELAAHLRHTGRSRFLLTAPPLRLPGAAGSPATPVATV